MRTLVRLLSIFALLGCAGAQNDVLDRVVAVVNNHVITQSDWDEQEMFEALMSGRTPEQAGYSQAGLKSLVDQMLIADQIASSHYFEPTPEQLEQQVALLRQQVAPGKNEAEWQSLLSAYGLSPEEFSDHVARQINFMRFVDMRFRPSVLITRERVQEYFDSNLLPEMRRSGVAEVKLPRLADVQEKIRDILTEQRINEMLSAWLEGLRSQAQIRMVYLQQDKKTPPNLASSASR